MLVERVAQSRDSKVRRLLRLGVLAGLVALPFVAASCVNSSDKDRAWLRQLEDESILTDPPAGFTQVTRSSIVGNKNYPEIQVGGSVSSLYAFSGMSTSEGVNAWVDDLTSHGWTVQVIDCAGTVGGYKDLDGFVASAHVAFDSKGAGLYLEAPPTDNPTTAPSLPAPNRC